MQNTHLASEMEWILQNEHMFTYVHSAQEEGWQLVRETIAIHTSFFSTQQEHNSIVLPNNQIVMMTYACLIDADKRGIRNQKENQIKSSNSTPLIKDLEISNIFKDKDDKEGDNIIDKLIKEVLWLLELVGLATQQIGDIVTGQVQTSHK